MAIETEIEQTAGSVFDSRRVDARDSNLIPDRCGVETDAADDSTHSMRTLCLRRSLAVCGEQVIRIIRLGTADQVYNFKMVRLLAEKYENYRQTFPRKEIMLNLFCYLRRYFIVTR